MLGAAIIVAATVLAYLPSLDNGYIWDDDQYVTKNMNLRSWQGLLDTWTKPTANPQYYPLVFTTFWIEYHLWALHPLGYHLVNVLLHAASAVVLVVLLRRAGVVWAFWVGLVFAIHPVCVESVAWATERKNVLSGLLYLLAAAAYLRFEPPEGGQRRWGFYTLTVVLFIGALLSKTVTCTLPAALGLVLWWKRPRLSLRDLWPLAPLLAIGAVMGLTTAWLEKAHVGAEGETWAFSIPQRMLIAGQALWFYASKLIWPSPLTFIYPRWDIDQASWWQYIFPLSAAAVIVALVLGRRRIGKAPAAAVLFFAGTLFPALGFFNVYPMRYSFVADHFQYLASIGLIALACGSLWQLRRRMGRVGQRSVVAGAVIVVIALAAVTWRQTRIYRGVENLWLDTLAKNPDCWLAHNNLGNILFLRGQVAEAIEHYQQAIKSRPNYAEAHYNMGNMLTLLGQVDQAIEQYRQALKSDPDHAEARYNLGNVLASQGQVDQAIEQYRQALKLKPNLAEAHYNLGNLLVLQGQVDQAIEQYRLALKSKPNFAEAYCNLGNALASQGQVGQAIEQYRLALKSNPNFAEAHNNLGIILAANGMLDEAIFHFERALQLKPGYVAARENLHKALAQSRAGRPATMSVPNSPTRP